MDESTRTWRDRVARWHKSGHSARVFAEQEGSTPARCTRGAADWA